MYNNIGIATCGGVGPHTIVCILHSVIYVQTVYIHYKFSHLICSGILVTCTCDCLGCAVLLCLVCLFDLACFFLSSFSSLI